MSRPTIDMIVYASWSQPTFKAAELEPLLEKARADNEKNGLTGLLLARSGCFIQVLEGERYNLGYTFKKIRDDPRHHGVRILLESSSDARLYSRWRMAYRDVDVMDPVLLQMVDDAMQSRKKLTTADVNQLLKKVSSAL